MKNNKANIASNNKNNHAFLLFKNAATLKSKRI